MNKKVAINDLEIIKSEILKVDKKKTTQKNNVEFVISNTYLSGFYEIIEKIKTLTNSDKFQNIILVVPDKFSLNAEQIFMERVALYKALQFRYFNLDSDDKQLYENLKVELCEIVN